ncbi:rhomboid family intramembrane serine protease [Mycoplasmatota bacterium]|nr:rhomboid family intramembrane serine protease [Mycoplasmatota bacterium]
MNMKRMSSSFVIENTELENYSLNLVHYFLDKEEYTIFNFEEKILENFNHDYYNIVYIYSAPLINDVNIDTLLDKLNIIKKRLRKNFFLFNQRFLIVATNCSLDFSKIDIPKNVDFINVTEKENLYTNDIIKQVYPDLSDYPLNISFQALPIKLNALSVAYAKKISSIFNKKQYTVNIVLSILIVSAYCLSLYSSIFHNIPNISSYIVLTRENIDKHYFHTLLTNNLYDYNLFSIVISLFLILSFGIRLEKIYGSIRYLGIILMTMLFTNSILFAFSNYQTYPVGFTPIVYTFVGSFIYVVILYRRFLANSFKRILYFNMFLFFMILVLGDSWSLISLVAALLAGFACSFIVGIPKAKNGNMKHRLLALIFVGILILLSISIGLK